MKLSYHQVCTLDKTNLLQDVLLAEKYGFCYMELIAVKLHEYLENHSEEDLCKLFSEHKIKVQAINGFEIYEGFMCENDDLQKREALLKEVEFNCRIGQKIGAKALVINMPKNSFESGKPYEKEPEQILIDSTAILNCLCELAQKYGIGIGVEVIGSKRSSIRTVRQVNSLFKTVNYPNLGYVLDPYNLFTYDDFFNALLNLLRREVEQDVQLRIHSIAHRAKIAPDPLMSLFTDDCIKLGKEYSIGGARYSIHGLLLTGVSNTVDSLASIKKLVFEEGKYTLREFAEAMRTNYAGKEIMRQEVLNRVPKFGNDQPYVDNIASELLGKFSDIIDEVSNKYKSEKQYLVAGIGTFQFALKFGNMIGASADGRLAQETLASNYSPFHGVDVSGPTASIRSITTPNLLPYVMGAPLDLEINPNEIIGEEGLNRMVGLIKAFKELGGLMLTLTGVSKEKLLDAQKNPEKYRSLRVRLGGFSAYFTMLTKEMQDSIIQRTSHTF